MKIFLDPGHNYSGGDTGASGFGLREEIVTFEIANKLRVLLQSAGHEVRMSRNYVTDNVGIGTVTSSLNERVRMSNSWGADLFISIHCNAGGGSGTETLIYSIDNNNATMVIRLQNTIVKNIGTVNRGIKPRPNLVVLKNTKCPALLIETAFIDNETDAWLLKSKTNEFAEAIFEGITGTPVNKNNTDKVTELTKINDIIWEYSHRGIVTDSKGMKKEMCDSPDGRLYWLARKTLQYMREHNI